MKILILDQFSEPGGAQLCLRDLSPEIARRGWQATFMAPGDGGIRVALESSGLRNEQLPGLVYTNGRKTFLDVIRYGMDIPSAILSILRFVKEYRPDLVYINGPRVLPAGIALPCPVVFHSHSLLDKQYSRLMAATCLRIKRAQVIAASRFAARSLERLVKAGSMRVIYSGVPDLGFTASRRRGDRTRIGIVGRIAPEKGQLDFVHAARWLSGPKRQIEFVVHGSSMFSAAGYEQRVRAEASGLAVDFPGWTQNVASALHNIDILAVPSSAIEAAGRVVMEALSAGTPVVAYPSGGIPELICDGRTGLLTEHSTPASLAQSIDKLLADPTLALRLAEQGRKEWESRFRVERFQRQVCDFLEAIVYRQRRERREIESAVAIAGENDLA
jgi:glycosyltransferase involved in cell wall biosynthesis